MWYSIRDAVLMAGIIMVGLVVRDVQAAVYEEGFEPPDWVDGVYGTGAGSSDPRQGHGWWGVNLCYAKDDAAHQGEQSLVFTGYVDGTLSDGAASGAQRFGPLGGSPDASAFDAATPVIYRGYVKLADPRAGNSRWAGLTLFRTGIYPTSDQIAEVLIGFDWDANTNQHIHQVRLRTADDGWVDLTYPAGWSLGPWYELTIQTDPAADKVRFTVNGQQVGPAMDLTLADSFYIGVDIWEDWDNRYVVPAKGVAFDDLQVDVVPEPSTAMLALCGLALLCRHRGLRRTRRGLGKEARLHQQTR
jgi:hypothetical protein